MARKGMRYKHIAAKVHTNARHVRAFLLQHGIELAPYSFRGKNNPRWKGGRILDKTGYVLLHMPDHPDCNHIGYVREHRLVMERHLKRRLLDSEVVHHKNREKQDNRIENLELLSCNAKHLVLELSGKVPNWTQAGLDRMREGIARSAKLRRPDTPIASARDVRQWW